MTRESKSLLDLMPEAERDKAIAKAEKRITAQQAKKGLSVSPEFYMAAEIGYYFGWEAIMALRRGYTVDPRSGDKEQFTTVEAQLLLEGARKVWYGKLVEHTQSGVIANTFNHASKSYDSAIRPFLERTQGDGNG